jgi:hypothetical protein
MYMLHDTPDFEIVDYTTRRELVCWREILWLNNGSSKYQIALGCLLECPSYWYKLIELAAVEFCFSTSYSVTVPICAILD